MSEIRDRQLAAALPEGWRLVGVNRTGQFSAAEIRHRVFGTLHVDVRGPLEAAHLTETIRRSGYEDAAATMPTPVTEQEAETFQKLQAMARAGRFDDRQIHLIVGLLVEVGAVGPSFGSWLRDVVVTFRP